MPATQVHTAKASASYTCSERLLQGPRAPLARPHQLRCLLCWMARFLRQQLTPEQACAAVGGM